MGKGILRKLMAPEVETEELIRVPDEEVIQQISAMVASRVIDEESVIISRLLSNSFTPKTCKLPVDGLLLLGTNEEGERVAIILPPNWMELEKQIEKRKESNRLKDNLNIFKWRVEQQISSVVAMKNVCSGKEPFMENLPVEVSDQIREMARNVRCALGEKSNDLTTKVNHLQFSEDLDGLAQVEEELEIVNTLFLKKEKEFFTWFLSQIKKHKPSFLDEDIINVLLGKKRQMISLLSDQQKILNIRKEELAEMIRIVEEFCKDIPSEAYEFDEVPIEYIPLDECTASEKPNKELNSKNKSVKKRVVKKKVVKKKATKKTATKKKPSKPNVN